MEKEIELLKKEAKELFSDLIAKSIAVFIFTFGICWSIKGLTNYDTFEYFKYVYVLYWIIIVTFKK